MVFKLTDYLDKRKGTSLQSVPVIKEANQVLNQYKKSVDKDLLAGDLSKTPTINSLVTQRYPKNISKRRQLEFQVKELSKATGFDSRAFLQNKKLELAQRLVTQNNLALKYDPDGKKGIFKKVGGEGTRAGQSDYTKQLYNILNTMDTADDKVVKALDVIIEQDLPLKSIKNAAEYKQTRGILNQMISEISGVGTDNLKTRLKKSKYYTKDFEDTINYINKIGRQHQDFEGIKFSEAFDFGKTRLAGAAELEGRNLLSFYKDPNTNITNYAFRHWDRTNFNNQPSRVKLYDKKKVVRKPSGAIVPKKGLSLEDAELKWKAGMKVKTKDLIFSYDDSELFDNTTLRTRGPASGLFDEVYDATKDYYNTYNKSVPDPKKPGKIIKFGELMERDFGKNALAIGHNAPGGVKAEPFKNFQIQTQQMNTALYNATKNIKSKELQKRVIQNIYGDLSGLTDEKYLQEFVKKPSTVPYREAVVGVKPKDLKTTKAVKELKQISPALKQSIAKLSPNPTCAVRPRKAEGGGVSGLDDCFREGMQALKEKNINKPHQIQGAKQLMNAGKRIGASTFARRLLDLGILSEIGFLAGDVGIRRAMGRPFSEAFKAATFRETQADKERIIRGGGSPEVIKARELQKKLESINQEIKSAESLGDYYSSTDIDALKQRRQNILKELAPFEKYLSLTSPQTISTNVREQNVIDADLAKSPFSRMKLSAAQGTVPSIADYGEIGAPVPEDTPINTSLKSQNKILKREIENYNKEQAKKLLPSSKEAILENLKFNLGDPTADREAKEFYDAGYEIFPDDFTSYKMQLEAQSPGREEQMYGFNPDKGLEIPSLLPKGTYIPTPQQRQEQEELMEEMGRLGAASGGLMNLTRTIPPESGPNAKGLESLRRYATRKY